MTVEAFNEFAIARFVMATFLFVFQMLTIRLFLVHPEYRSTCFRIMLCSGLCDSCWLFIQGILPFFLFLHNFFADWAWLEKFFGALSQSVYDTLYLLNFLLAVNRLCVIVKLHILCQFGEGEPCWERRINRLLQLLVALFFLAEFILFCSPLLGLSFDADLWVWTNDMNCSLMELETHVEMYFFNNAFPLAIMAIYVLVFVIVKMRSNRLVSQADSLVAARQRANQWRILIQCAVQFVVFQIPAVYFMTGWSPGKTTLQRSGFVKLLMTAICGVSPLIYIALLPNFRQKFITDYLAPCGLVFSLGGSNANSCAPAGPKQLIRVQPVAIPASSNHHCPSSQPTAAHGLMPS